MQGAEKREWQRVVVNMQAKCRAVDGPARYEMINIVDMHQHGCCVLGYFQLEKGQIVRVVLDLPFEGQISMTGEVKWSEAVNEEGEYRSGLGFIIDTPTAEETCLKLYHFCLIRQPKI